MYTLFFLKKKISIFKFKSQYLFEIPRFRKKWLFRAEGSSMMVILVTFSKPQISTLTIIIKNKEEYLFFFFNS